MTTQRTVKKNLIGQEDILYGEGSVTQARGKGTYPISKVRIIYPVNSLAELTALDTDKFTKARLYTADGFMQDYEYYSGAWNPVGPLTSVTFATLLATAVVEGRVIYTTGRYVDGDPGASSYKVHPVGTAPSYDNGKWIYHALSDKDLENLFPYGANIAHWGADPSQTPVVNTTAIQAAWNYTASAGQVCKGAPGIFLIERSGNQINGRDYGLLIPDGLKFDGQGRSSCVLKAAPNSDMDVVTTPRTAAIKGLELVNFTVDGDSASQTPVSPNQTAGGMNVWVQNVEDLRLDNIESTDSAAFGFRLAIIDNFSLTNLKCDHRPDINADGVHIKDATNGVVDKIVIHTKGDDGFIINAEASDVHDISIGEVVINAPVFVAAGRGMYISNAEANAAAGIQKNLYNISIANLVTYNCDATALLLAFGNFYNITINHTDYGSVVGFGLIVGSATGAGVTGAVKNCSFTSLLTDSQTNAVSFVPTDGLVSFTDFNFIVQNPGDGHPGATLSAEDCAFSILMDYDPSSSKVTPLQGIRHSPGTPFARNTLNISVNGANVGLELNSGATDNTIHLGSVTNSVSFDIDFNSGANSNTLIGGSIATYQNAGTGNTIVGTRGASGYGRLSLSPDGSGKALIPHGLIAAPDYFQVTIFTGSAITAAVSFRDSTHLEVTFRDYTGALVTTGSHQVAWEAKIF